MIANTVVGGAAATVVARVAQISRQAIYRPRLGDVEVAIVEVALANPTDGYRIVGEWVCRNAG